MKESVYLKDELVKKTDVNPELMDQLEKLKILQPTGITEDAVAFYSDATIQHVNYVKQLMGMGYSLEAIQKIIKKVGLPKIAGSKGKNTGTKKYLTVGGLSASVGVSARTIKHWEEKGIIEADMRSDGGFRLYSETYIFLCKLIRDLQLFGYSLDQIKNISDLFRLFTQIQKGLQTYSPGETDQKFTDMLNEINELRGRITLFKEGIERWEELINKKTKEIQTLLKENAKRKKSEKEVATKDTRKKSGEKS
jgi:DNA-binding transcriptional MerR regulator